MAGHVGGRKHQGRAATENGGSAANGPIGLVARVRKSAPPFFGMRFVEVAEYHTFVRIAFASSAVKFVSAHRNLRKQPSISASPISASSQAQCRLPSRSPTDCRST